VSISLVTAMRVYWRVCVAIIGHAAEERVAGLSLNSCEAGFGAKRHLL
jgi:hypothetical protein